MHLSNICFVAAALLQTTAAFRCPVGQNGECYYFKGNTQDQERCAIHCPNKGAYTQCNCPDYNPTSLHGKYSGRHDCITLGKYNGRHKCY